MNTRKLLLLLLTGINLQAVAADQAPCPPKDRGTLEEWKCFVYVEYIANRDGQAEFEIRFLNFANGEQLYSMRKGGVTEALISGKSFQLFQGLQASNVRHPFFGIGYALIYPLAPLAATKKLPHELPIGATRISYTGPLAGMIVDSLDGVVERISTTDYKFDAVLKARTEVAAPASSTTLTGRWSNMPVQQYPDEMEMTNWQYQCGPKSGMNPSIVYRAVPTGVSLGAIRRGWNGECD